MAEDHTDI